MSYFYGAFGFVLREIYHLVNNYGLALIIFTFIARLLMFPTSISQQKNTAKMQRMQTKVKKIQQKYAGDQRKIQEETQALYSREGTNPMGAGCLPLVIQLPIIYGLIGVIYRPLKYVLRISDGDIATLTTALKNVVEVTKSSERTIQLLIIENIDKLSGAVPTDIFNKIASFDFEFLGLPLGQVPQIKHPSALWIVPILSGLSSLASSFFMYMRQRSSDPQAAKNPTMGCMTFGMPLFSLYFTFQFPVGIGIYWIASNLFAFLQMVILNFTHSPKKMLAKELIEETVQRRSREENLKRVAEIKNNAR
ncbi:MAG: YidC/Oxa1 family membrane protein insertase [Clostridiales bacterium]|nr:YidC/Oxa1 family membrane protein insertase [Clostridiales bacterium]